MSNAGDELPLRPRTITREGNSYIIACSLCGNPSGSFEVRTNVRIHAGKVVDAILYVGALDDHWRHEEVPRLQELLEAGAVKELHEAMASLTWDQVQRDDPGRTYRVGQPSYGIDSYCPTCDAVYCKNHLKMATSGASGYGGVIDATCPEGHERRVYDDSGGC